MARRRGKILFVGCKKQAQEAIKEAAQACGQFYVNQRWLGGTLTNLSTIRRSIARLKYIEEIEKAPEYKMMGKQELAALGREGAKLGRNLDGIRTMDKLPDAIIIIDTARETNAVAEARRLKIPTVAIVDTNADPTLITHPIAATTTPSARSAWCSPSWWMRSSPAAARAVARTARPWPECPPDTGSLAFQPRIPRIKVGPPQEQRLLP